MTVAIVTGASRGIGKEIAKELSKQGIKVIANYNKSEEQAKILQNENPEIDIFKADISNRVEVKQMIDYTLKKYGKIDILINNAGIAETKLFTDVTDEDWDKIINTNAEDYGRLVLCLTYESLLSYINKIEKVLSEKHPEIKLITSAGWTSQGEHFDIAYDWMKHIIETNGEALSE